LTIFSALLHTNTKREEVMFKSKLFWYVMMMGAVAGWIFSIFGLVCPFKNDVIKIIWMAILFIWAIGHPLELFVSIPIGKKAGLSIRRTVVKTLFLGFTWWLPLKLGVIKR
jgi:hypothetical protein